ncbi:MAG: GDP-mannose 4,6-dehydratase [Phycisphaerales bacterium]|nr:GDP-mannose 4,6-dehydratase [Phycisphaerales bacterium]MCI0674628.1 GDP-mannose 4,6-dehydratase [Phycisphaerales bacterium]
MKSRRTVVVTGAAGFIGSHLSAALRRLGRSVLGIDNFDAFYERASKQANLERIGAVKPKIAQRHDAFQFIEADICDRQAIRAILERATPDVIFHIAALAGVRPSIAQPQRYVSVNVNGLVNVLEAARAVNCRRFIFASSSSVYGNHAKVPFSEDDRVDQPISPYAATKRAGELICQTYAHLFAMRIAALRFFTVYGPAQRPDLAISKFMRLIAEGREVPMYGDGSTSRDYTYIDDVIAGVIAAEKSLPADDSPAGFFRIWNLGSDHPITLIQMIDAIASVVGKPPRIKTMPMQPGDVERTWADITRSKAELGYHPTTSFEEGLLRQRSEKYG